VGTTGPRAPEHNDKVSFEPGDEVHVAALGTGIVREVRNGGRYLVELKGRSVVAAESQLTAASGRRASTRSNTRTDEPHVPTRSYAPVSLDLHGLKAEEAVAALDDFVNEALLAGHAEVHIIHGRSGGVLKRAVHARLKQLPAIRAFRLDPRNPGMTIVSL
jgi:DNA mismatch repair protein MutS2